MRRCRGKKRHRILQQDTEEEEEEEEEKEVESKETKLKSTVHQNGSAVEELFFSDTSETNSELLGSAFRLDERKRHESRSPSHHVCDVISNDKAPQGEKAKKVKKARTRKKISTMASDVVEDQETQAWQELFSTTVDEYSKDLPTLSPESEDVVETAPQKDEAAENSRMNVWKDLITHVVKSHPHGRKNGTKKRDESRDPCETVEPEKRVPPSHVTTYHVSSRNGQGHEEPVSPCVARDSLQWSPSESSMAEPCTAESERWHVSPAQENLLFGPQESSEKRDGDELDMEDALAQIYSCMQQEYADRTKEKLQHLEASQKQRRKMIVEHEKFIQKHLLLTTLRHLCPKFLLWTEKHSLEEDDDNADHRPVLADSQSGSGAFYPQNLSKPFLIPTVALPLCCQVDPLRSKRVLGAEMQKQAADTLHTEWSKRCFTAHKWCLVEGFLGKARNPTTQRDRLHIHVESKWLGADVLSPEWLNKSLATQHLKEQFTSEMIQLHHLVDPSVAEMLEIDSLLNQIKEFRKWREKPSKLRISKPPPVPTEPLPRCLDTVSLDDKSSCSAGDTAVLVSGYDGEASRTLTVEAQGPPHEETSTWCSGGEGTIHSGDLDGVQGDAAKGNTLCCSTKTDAPKCLVSAGENSPRKGSVFSLRQEKQSCVVLEKKSRVDKSNQTTLLHFCQRHSAVKKAEINSPSSSPLGGEATRHSSCPPKSLSNKHLSSQVLGTRLDEKSSPSITTQGHGDGETYVEKSEEPLVFSHSLAHETSNVQESNMNGTPVKTRQEDALYEDSSRVIKSQEGLTKRKKGRLKKVHSRSPKEVCGSANQTAQHLVKPIDGHESSNTRVSQTLRYVDAIAKEVDSDVESLDSTDELSKEHFTNDIMEEGSEEEDTEFLQELVGDVVETKSEFERNATLLFRQQLEEDDERRYKQLFTLDGLNELQLSRAVAETRVTQRQVKRQIEQKSQLDEETRKEIEFEALVDALRWNKNLSQSRPRDTLMSEGASDFSEEEHGVAADEYRLQGSFDLEPQHKGHYENAHVSAITNQPKKVTWESFTCSYVPRGAGDESSVPTTLQWSDGLAQDTSCRAMTHTSSLPSTSAPLETHPAFSFTVPETDPFLLSLFSNQTTTTVNHEQPGAQQPSVRHRSPASPLSHTSHMTNMISLTKLLSLTSSCPLLNSPVKSRQGTSQPTKSFREQLYEFTRLSENPTLVKGIDPSF